MMRIIYAVLTAVFAISATLMLSMYPSSLWGRLYVILAIVMFIMCADATIRSRNSMKKNGESDHGGKVDAGGDDTGKHGGDHKAE